MNSHFASNWSKLWAFVLKVKPVLDPEGKRRPKVAMRGCGHCVTTNHRRHAADIGDEPYLIRAG